MARKKQIVEEVLEEIVEKEELIIPENESLSVSMPTKAYVVIVAREKDFIVKDENGNGFYLPITEQNKNFKVGDTVYLNF